MDWPGADFCSLPFHYVFLYSRYNIYFKVSDIMAENDAFMFIIQSLFGF